MSSRSNNPDFFIGVGNTLPTLDAALFGGQPRVPANLTGSTVTCSLSTLGGTVIFSRAASVTDAVDGRVQYTWQAGDTDTAGTYLARFHVTYGSGDIQDFPNDRFIEVRIS